MKASGGCGGGKRRRPKRCKGGAQWGEAEKAIMEGGGRGGRTPEILKVWFNGFA